MAQYLAVYSAEPLYGMPNLWVACDGLTLESNLGFPFMQAISHALKTEGRADGMIEFFRDGEVEPAISFPSLFALAQAPGKKPGFRTINDRPTPSPRRYPAPAETPAERAYAAGLIGLSDDRDSLHLVEQCLSRSLHDLHRLGWKVQATLPTRRHFEPEIMFKRKLVAAIIRAAGRDVLL